jgi:hypothetical protein
MDRETALGIIQIGQGTHFEARIAEAFIGLVRDGSVDDVLRGIAEQSASLVPEHAAA